MVNVQHKKSALTLLLSVLVAVTVFTTTAHAADLHARRDHADVKRMLKMRAPPEATTSATASATDLAGLLGDDVTSSATSTSSKSASVTPSVTSESSSSSSATSVSVSSAATSSTSDGGLLGGIISSVLAPSSASSSSSSTTSSSSSSSTSSSTSSSSSTTSSSSSTEKTTTPTTATPETTPVVTETSSNPRSTVFASVEASASASSTEAPSDTSGGLGDTTIKGPALTAIIVVAASVGGIILIWTIFRKWKLSRSKQFDQRLQPIDWQPSPEEIQAGTDLRRRTSDTSSFHSGSGHNDLRGYGATQGSPDHTRLQPLPEHDFTASAVGGYADLSRGPSPQPPMAEGNLMRGPSLAGPNYDNNLPLHYQAGYGQQQQQQDYSNYRY